jgi:hypothetical protein
MWLFLDKKPLKRQPSVYTNSENALAANFAARHPG